MSRIRSIKPEILDDEVAAGLSDAAWRLWVSSWVLADDHGNFRAGTRYLAARVWQDSSHAAAEPLLELSSKGRVKLYAVAGQRYAHINGWGTHQRIDNAGNPRVPVPEDDDGTWERDVTPLLADKLAGPYLLAKSSARARPRAQFTPPEEDHDQDQDHDHSVAEEPATRTRTRAPRGTRITPDWTLDAGTLEHFAKQGVDARRCVPEFVDYWVAVPGQKGVKVDWQATFRNRVRQLIELDRAPALTRPRLVPTVAPPPADAVPMPPEVQESFAELLAAKDLPARSGA